MIAEIARILATFGIGISATSSAPSHIDEDGVAWNDLVFILHTCPWGQLQMALEEIAQISFVAPGSPRAAHRTPSSSILTYIILLHGTYRSKIRRLLRGHH